MSDINLHNIEEIVIAECPACGDMAAFLYVGVQEGYKGEQGFVWYNCFECGTTRSHTSIL